MEFWNADGGAEKGPGPVVLSGHKHYLATTPCVALGSTAQVSPADVAVLEIWKLRTYPDFLNETLS